MERNETTLGFQGNMTWPDVYFSDRSGGVHSRDPRLRRAGWSVACLKQDAELKEACHGSAPGRQTFPRAEVDAQYFLTSSAKLARAKRGTNGDLWLRFFDACDNKPQCIARVTRVWRSHLTLKELDIGCSTLVDMRGNTFADEMAGRAATRVEVLPSQANAVQAIDGTAWQVRMRIIEANLAGFSAQPIRAFLPPRAPAPQEKESAKKE